MSLQESASVKTQVSLLNQLRHLGQQSSDQSKTYLNVWTMTMMIKMTQYTENSSSSSWSLPCLTGFLWSANDKPQHRKWFYRITEDLKRYFTIHLDSAILRQNLFGKIKTLKAKNFGIPSMVRAIALSERLNTYILLMSC